jgi:hypothetical protein
MLMIEHMQNLYSGIDKTLMSSRPASATYWDHLKMKVIIRLIYTVGHLIKCLPNTLKRAKVMKDK